jgi:hypothetical protein
MLRKTTQGARRRFGNMIFSRFAVRQVFRHLLPWPADPGVSSMQRMALEATLQTPLGLLRVTTRPTWNTIWPASAPPCRDAWGIAHPGQPHAPTVGLHDKAQWPGPPFGFDFMRVSRSGRTRAGGACGAAQPGFWPPAGAARAGLSGGPG